MIDPSRLRLWAGVIVAVVMSGSPGWLEAAVSEVVLVLGDSLSAGYGIESAASWPSLLAQRLRQEGYPHRVVNASISGETTAGGARRLAPLLDEHQPAVVVIALGANDGLRGLAVDEIARNLARLVAVSSASGAVPVLLRVRIPPNYGPQYSGRFEQVFDEVADSHDVIYAPFMLERFAIMRAAFQADGLHPTAAVQPQILDTLWPSIAQALTRAATAAP